MGLNCGASCVRYVLFAFNIIFFLGGAAVLGVGIWIRVDTGSYYDFLGKVDGSGESTKVVANILSDNISYIHAVAYVLIGVGAFVFLVGFLGCCGAIKQARPLLVAYAICLIVIMGIEMGVGIAVGVNKDKALKTIEDELTKWTAFYDYRETSVNNGLLVSGRLVNATGDASMTNGWNAMQVYLGCCGVRDYTDFKNSPYARNGGQSHAPAFCCKMSDKPTLKLQDPACGLPGADRNLGNSNFKTGCLSKVTSFVEDNAPAVIGVAVGIGLIELIGVIFAFCLCCAIGDKGKRYN
ncbi:putative Tetraspanin-9 [Hypsibius exemplaris]|uniref:Tetraspanin n=1 Tax=Hypsibius exemplaris TaxID=2072580 RepID=A0A1W0X4I2_HYPEX|nr:putative Tetraspanin-9 [Hypsibius exemplaris]